MKYLIDTNYRVAEVKDQMVDMGGGDYLEWYLYTDPAAHSGFKVIHKSHTQK